MRYKFKLFMIKNKKKVYVVSSLMICMFMIAISYFLFTQSKFTDGDNKVFIDTSVGDFSPSKQLVSQVNIGLDYLTDGENIYPNKTNYISNITCDNASANYNSKYDKVEITNVVGLATCNLTFTTSSTSYTTLSSIVQSNATYFSLSDSYGNANAYNLYNYTGANPNNYVWFNNELWRIIGKSDLYGSSYSNNVKIIRDQPLVSIPYTVNNTNNTNNLKWSNATSKILLNNYYYGALDGRNYSGCKEGIILLDDNCNFAKTGIKIGSIWDEMIYTNAPWSDRAIDFGAYNRFQIVLGERDTISNSGRIGTISLGDYLYSLPNNTTYDNVIINDSNFYTTASYTWLFNGEYQNTLTPSSNTVITIKPDGGLNNYLFGMTIRPTIYLKSNVYKISGTGTIVDPYIIGVN